MLLLIAVLAGETVQQEQKQTLQQKQARPLVS